jgi:eukaryotic-like serine/threonine-protein kinase
MSLAPGARFGSYEVIALLGAGGMGEVYRARDLKLNREVALKLLPEQFALDPDRAARFKREAELLASLNHPNIAAIYGREDSAPTQALVLELVEGPTLADRIAEGPIPVGEALPIARQIADALDAAHEHGVIHRDLKPGNIKLRPDGTVKVLDFGLAKLNDPTVSNVASAPSALSLSPTITNVSMMTGVGLLLGTAAYMSPEQAKGRAVDKRADIFAFGCVLYEMLTGRRAFAGDDVSDTLAFVLTKDADWNELPASTPQSIRKLLRRCLEKDRRRRLADVADARLEIDEALTAPSPAVDGPSNAVGSNRRREPIAWAIAAVLFATSIGLAIPYFRSTPSEASSTRFTVSPPQNVALINGTNQLVSVLSPDGRRVAFIAPSGGSPLLWVRSFDRLDAQPLAGTENALLPFWSPDGRTIGFFANNKLKTVSANGGPVQSLCDVPGGRGGAWNRDGVIVFSPNNAGGLLRVSAAGGQPTPLTTVQGGVISHRFPSFLSDGRRFVYFVYPSNEIWLGSLDGTSSTRLLSADSQAQYAPPGYLLFARQGTLMAQPFDEHRAVTTGDAVPFVEQVVADSNFYAPFSASNNGTIAYRTGLASQVTQLTWFDRDGKPLGIAGQPGNYRNPLLAPDGTRIALEMSDAQGRNQDIWLLELARGVLTRFTFDPHNDVNPVWSPDGTRIAFGSDREGGFFGIYEKQANGATGERLVLKSSSGNPIPYSWSPDGKFILHRAIVGGAFNTGFLSMVGDGKSQVFQQQSSFSQTLGQVSPDGRWIAYQSNESGRYEIYVQTFPAPGGKWQISRDGGFSPKWRADGKEIFYYAADGRLMAAPVTGNNAALDVGTAVPLFKARILLGPTAAVGFRQQYDVTPDGKRFLINVPIDDSAAASSITVVLNWPAALNK